jgi:hypothetical protein
MVRMMAPVLTTLALPAFAHDGFHPHPHGIQYGWIIAVIVAAAGGYALARLRGRK